MAAEPAARSLEDLDGSSRVHAQYITDRRVPHISLLATTRNIKSCEYSSTSLPDIFFPWKSQYTHASTLLYLVLPRMQTAANAPILLLLAACPTQ
jgi:hypothetical protein